MYVHNYIHTHRRDIIYNHQQLQTQSVCTYILYTCTTILTCTFFCIRPATPSGCLPLGEEEEEGEDGGSPGREGRPAAGPFLFFSE